MGKWRLYPKYKCPVCYELHDDEQEALQCCPRPIEEVYLCPVCKSEHDDEEYAIECCGFDPDGPPPPPTAAELEAADSKDFFNRSTKEQNVKEAKNPIPEGYKEDARGALVPIQTIRPIDLARDELVREIAAKAKEESERLAKFKAGVFGDIEAFVQLSGEKYGVSMGGKKGNVSLLSFDGRYKVQRAISESMVFDERLQVAKELVDQCIHEWSDGARVELKALINDAFQVDKEGRVNTARILSLRRLEITDEKWQRAMQAIGESLQVAGSKAYFRVYERVGDSDQYQAISLDIAAV